jgi:uncharacterized delta-60 repeat protein
VAHALVLQPDGKIVVAGTATPATDWDFGLARYNPNGTLDATFGAGGRVTTDISGHLSADLVWAVALQPDGKLVVAGSTTGPSGEAFALARYMPSGGLDGSFGSSGRVTTSFGGDQDWAQAVAVQPDGKIVAAGKTGNQCCLGTFNFALARFNAGGTLDSAFGTGGKVTTDFAGGTDNAHALVIQADGKLLAGGERLPGGNVSGASFDFALARYQPGGTLDPTFGSGGLVTTDFPGHNDHVYALALQQDGKVVAAGDSSPDFALARYAATRVNNPPAASDDSYAADQDTPLTVPAPGVLANDSDADGDPLTAALATGPAHGTLALDPDGSFAYTPTAGFAGQDSFTYKASDGLAASDAATVMITVNHTPSASNDGYGTDEDAPLTAPAPGVLANDTDADGDPLSAALVAGPAHGTLTLHADGSFAYTPAADFNGNDTFAYKASDGRVDSNAATVTITVAPKVLFTSTRDGNPEIYAMNADGTAQTALSISPGINATPAWGPDGRIAFSSTRDGNVEIYVMPATGEAGCQVKACTIAKRLTTNPAIDTSPTWLGQGIAFASTRDDPNSEVYVMQADGTGVTRLTTNPASDAFPDW